MHIVITGATGLIGTELIKSLILRADTNISIYTRNISRAKKTLPFPINYFKWNPDENTIDPTPLKTADVVINLAGENIANKRWNPAQKEKLISSRIKPIELLLKELKKPDKKVQFISASAIGIYGNRGEERITEDSKLSNDFLAEVCKKWEAPLLEEHKNIKSNLLRIGLVITSKGGALTKMLPIFKLGLGGPISSGEQYMSWIHIEDLINKFIYVIDKKPEQTIINAVSPRPVSNYIFSTILGKELKRPAILPAPSFALKIILGEMSQLLLTGQKVIPQFFLDHNFNYKYRSLKDALREELKHAIKGESVFEQYQWIEKKPDDIFPFFSNEYNLEKITPPFLGFKVLGKNTDEIKSGTLIDYSLKLHGIPLKWKTEILEFKPNEYFIDQQLKGPYKKWFHQHKFYPLKNGTLMVDHITYKPPMGILGRLFAGSYIRKDVTKIFNYRREIIEKEF